MIAEIEVTVWVPEQAPDGYCCMWDECIEVVGHGDDAEEAMQDLCNQLSEITWH